MHRPTDRIDELIDLREAYATLPENCRRVVYLYFDMGWNQCQIARQLRITQPAVSQLLERAAAAYKTILETRSLCV